MVMNSVLLNTPPQLQPRASHDKLRVIQKASANKTFQLCGKDMVKLIDMLNEEEDYLWELASILLAQIGRPAVEPLIAALRYESAQIRMLAANILGEIGDSRAIVPLMNLFADRDKEVQESARKATKQLVAEVMLRN